MNSIFVIIPVYQPDERLIRLLEEMSEKEIGPICLVDDGSGINFRSLFEEARKIIEKSGGILLTHPVNMGKGQALKTAFAYLINNKPEITGVVTADSDGQHTPECIQRVMDALAHNPQSLILGVRHFDHTSVPFKSRFGNTLTRTIFFYLTGTRITDTQTGLRGIPLSFLPQCLEIKENRFEYEMRMLTEAVGKYMIKEVPIDTVYDSASHHQTHFRPLLDSYRVYKVLFERLFLYAFSSLSSFALDFLLFYFCCKALAKSGSFFYISVSTVIARVISATYNFLMNHKIVFQSDHKFSKTIPRYALLAVCQMVASALLVTVLKVLFPFAHEVACKAVVDTVLFFISYQIQQRMVF